MRRVRNRISVVTLSVLSLCAIAPAQSIDAPDSRRTFEHKTDENPRLFRTAREALESGLSLPDTRPGTQRGAVEPNACTMDASCAQPNDGQNGILVNTGSHILAESFEVESNGTLTRACVSFIVGGASGCPDVHSDPDLLDDWSIEFYTVLPGGDVDESNAIASFDTEAPLDNMDVTVSNGGLFSGHFIVVDVSFDLTNGGSTSGLTLNAGEHVAMSILWDNPPCDIFWSTSGDSGDGLHLASQTNAFDPVDDAWNECRYFESDLMLCLDIDSSPPDPAFTPDYSQAPSNDECDSPMTIDCDTTITQCLRFATANTATDPPLAPCVNFEELPDTYTGFNTVWYEVTPSHSRLLLSLCESESPFTSSDDRDLLMSVYKPGSSAGEGVGPCNLVQLACADLGCPSFFTLPEICLNDLTPGETLLVQVAAQTEADASTISLRATCDPMNLPPAPANDHIENAELVELGDASEVFVSGSTRCATLDPIATDCNGVIAGTAPGVWYTAVGDGTIWRITQSIAGGGNYDSQISVYCGSPETGLNCVAANNDASDCCPPQADLRLCTRDGVRYYIFMHGFYQAGEFGILFSNVAANSSENCPFPNQEHATECPAAVPCPADCNTDGVVNFADLTATLFAFGDAGGAESPCDANDDGQVNFNDLTAALFLFGDCP